MRLTRPVEGEPFWALPRHPAMATDHLDATSRLDPYWGSLWHGSAKAAMETWATNRTLCATSGDPVWERDRRYTPKDARNLLKDIDHPLFRRRLQGLAPVAMYGVVSNEQIAAFVGASEIARHAEDLLLAYTGGLLKRGFPSNSAHRRRNSRCPVDLYAPNQGPAVRAVFERQLNAAVRTGVTSDHRWETASNHPRHDVLAAELALRIAEGAWENIPLVLGETAAKLAEIAAMRDSTKKAISARAADLLIYRRDHLPIAVEVTANVGVNFREKVDAWMEVLAGRSTDDDGCAVLFLEAGHPHRSNSIATSTRSKIFKAITYNLGSSGSDRAAERMFFARWSDWFPGLNTVDTDAFPRLTAKRIHGTRWHDVELTDPAQVPFNPRARDLVRARYDARHLSWAIPYWLRDEVLARANAAPLARARLDALDPDLI